MANENTNSGGGGKLKSVWSTVSLSRIKQQFYNGATPKPDKSHTTSDRGQWAHKIEFFLATLGYSVGVGNLTRFPYMCMKNGGGAFLVPFIVALCVGGLPLFYIELALGQFSGLSPLTMWSFCPVFRGVGYACVILSGICCIYYNMLLAWCIFYLVSSFASDVPWRGCDNSWNSEKCYDPFSEKICESPTNSTFPTNLTTTLMAPVTNETSSNCTQRPADFLLPSEDFWNNVVLGIDTEKGLEDIGNLRWQLVLCLAGAWIIVFLCLMKGVQSSGKVVYVTATAPYLLITALLIRGVTLEGAAEGLTFYLKPNLTVLADHNVWLEASLQMFYSLGPAWGGLITMASYNKFHHKLNIEAAVIPITDVFTALYGGFAIFSVIGFMAKKASMPIKRFAASGAGLAFVVYPQAVAEMPVSTFWSICFFLTLITLGIDSQFGMVDTVVSGLFDLYPRLRNHKVKLTAAVAIVCFIIGLPICTEGGMFVYVLIDWYTAAITITAVAFLESIIVAYIYGINRFSADIKLMLGSEPNILWKFGWLVASPLFMGVLLFIGLWNLRAPSYRGYVYPPWAVAVGWLIALVSFIPIPVFAIHAILTSPHKTISKKMSSVFTPTSEWIPAKEDLVDNYRHRYIKHGEVAKKHAPSEQRCVYCQEEPRIARHTVKCESIFKCWVFYCTCRIFGAKKKVDEDDIPEKVEEANNEDVASSASHEYVNRGFEVGSPDDQKIEDELRRASQSPTSSSSSPSPSSSSSCSTCRSGTTHSKRQRSFGHCCQAVPSPATIPDDEGEPPNDRHRSGRRHLHDQPNRVDQLAINEVQVLPREVIIIRDTAL